MARRRYGRDALAGKWRGAAWEPIAFKLEGYTSDTMLDRRGRPMPTVIARPILDVEKPFGEAKKTEDRENRALAAIKGEFADLG